MSFQSWSWEKVSDCNVAILSNHSLVDLLMTYEQHEEHHFEFDHEWMKISNHMLYARVSIIVLHQYCHKKL